MQVAERNEQARLIKPLAVVRDAAAAAVADGSMAPGSGEMTVPVSAKFRSNMCPYSF
eukprot:SAG31_NODE_479_length_15133_cov_39.816283_9_plen_57_part_00